MLPLPLPLPLPLQRPSPPSARLRRLLVLLLLALGLLAGVSLSAAISQTRALEAQVQHSARVALPALKQVHELADRVDELRGMAALQLTLRGDAERAALDERLHASRQLVERRMAAFGKRLVDDTERGHHQQVLASLAAFWAAQEQLLALSRRAGSEPAAALQARALLAGEAQQAYLRLRADIAAWWAYAERQAEQAAAQASTAAQRLGLLLWAQAALLAAALALAWARQWRPQPQPLLATPVSAAAALAGSTAAQQHLQALNAAVAAARRGEPGRAAGLSALEAQRLAEQVAAAAQGLRRLIDRPDPPHDTSGTASAVHGEHSPPGAPPRH